MGENLPPKMIVNVDFEKRKEAHCANCTVLAYNIVLTKNDLFSSMSIKVELWWILGQNKFENHTRVINIMYNYYYDVYYYGV